MTLRRLLLSTVVARAVAYFNTNAASKLYISSTAQPTALDQAGYEGLTWVQVKGVGSHGEVGSSTNMLTYDTWDDDTVQKAKGLTDAGSPTVELARDATDPGQILMRTAANGNFNWAFKIERNDKTTPTGTGTVRYNRGLVAGPTVPQGRNEDFDLEVFTLGLQQKQITVDPTSAGNAPLLTVAPAITGTAQVNSLLTVSNGTFTGDATLVRSYQWFIGGVAKSGATANTYLPVTADIGKVITARVTCTNLAGVAQGFAPPTSAVIA
jgi:hypothetical protein